MRYYSLPADFNNETIDKYSALNNKYSESQVEETYGNITIDNLYSSGRSIDALPELDFNKLKDYVKYSKEHGIGFNYTLNAPSLKNMEITKSGLHKIKEFLNRLWDIQVDSMTVSLPSLIEIIKSLNPDIRVKVSAISSVNTPNKALAYKKMGVDKIVIEETVNRDFRTLENIIKCFDGKVEVIANVVCYKNCIYRTFHYNSYIFDSVRYQSDYKYYITRCSQRMLNDPSIFMKNSWIRPEDICHYDSRGVHHFKLQGRDIIQNADPARAVEYYFKESFDGNLWELIMMFDKHFIPSVNIDNKKLDGFLNPFMFKDNFCKNMCHECGYCDEYVKKAMDLSHLSRFKKYVNSKNYDLFSKDLGALKDNVKTQ